MIDFSNVDKHISELIDKMVFGAAVRIMKGDDIVFEKCYGYANKEKGYPITTHSEFRLASNTKIVTGVAVILCQQMGLLHVTDYVDKYLPEFKELYVKDENFNIIDEHPYRITIRQLLDHSSGFGTVPHEHKIYQSIKEDDRRDLKSYIDKYVQYHALAFVPGSNRSYSSFTAFDVLGRIIEVVSGMPYEAFLKKYIFEPLDMPNTKYSYEGVKPEDKVISADINDKGELYQYDEHNRTFDTFAINYPSGGAGLISTIEDYSHLMRMLTNKGVYKGKVFLTKESFDCFTHKIRIYYPDGRYEDWGCSVFYRLPEWKMIPRNAFGWSGAYGTHAWSDPDNDITVVYMHNTVHPGDGGAGARHTLVLENDVCTAFKLEY